MESIVSIVFEVESEAYQAMTALKKAPITKQRIISQAVLAKKVDGHIVVEDGFDTGLETADDTHLGGLLGGLVGIIGGPVGVLLSGSIGALSGSLVDSFDTEKMFL